MTLGGITSRQKLASKYLTDSTAVVTGLNDEDERYIPAPAGNRGLLLIVQRQLTCPAVLIIGFDTAKRRTLCRANALQINKSGYI